MNVDELAQEIRRVDGKHTLGAGALAEALIPFLDRYAEAVRSGTLSTLSEKYNRFAESSEEPITRGTFRAISSLLQEEANTPWTKG